MSTTKGRKVVKDSAGNGIYSDTIKKKSAEQAMLVKMDELIDELNNCRAALKGIAAKLDLDAGVTDVNYASLWTNVIGATAIKKPDLK